MNQSCAKLLLADAFSDFPITEREIDEIYENRNFNYKQTLYELSLASAYLPEFEKDIHLHRKDFNFYSFAEKRSIAQEEARKAAMKEHARVIDFHNISRYASKQFVTRVLSDLDPKKNYNLSLVVGQGRHSQDQKSLTKTIVQELCATSPFGPGEILPSNPGMIKYHIESVNDPVTKTSFLRTKKKESK